MHFRTNIEVFTFENGSKIKYNQKYSGGTSYSETLKFNTCLVYSASRLKLHENAPSQFYTIAGIELETSYTKREAPISTQ